jgi:hypothetical protein
VLRVIRLLVGSIHWRSWELGVGSSAIVESVSARD